MVHKLEILPQKRGGRPEKHRNTKDLIVEIVNIRVNALYLKTFFPKPKYRSTGLIHCEFFKESAVSKYLYFGKN